MAMSGTEWPTASPETSRVQIGTQDTIFWQDLGEKILCCARWGRGLIPGILKVYFSIYKSQQPHGRLLKGQEKKVRVGERSIAASVVIWTMATAGLIISCNVALITSKKKKKWIFQQEPFWAFLYSSPNRKNNHLLKQNRGEKTILIYRFSFISIQIT